MLTLLRILFTLVLMVPAFAGPKVFLGIIPGDGAALKASGFQGEGLLIKRVVEGGPAEKGGIHSGDVLVELDGKPVADLDDLSFFLRRFDPGDEIDVIVSRDGQTRKHRITLAEPPTREIETSSQTPTVVSTSGRAFLGISVTGINDNLLEYFGVDQGVGVLIDNVVEDSPADRAGLMVGDVLVQIEGHDVESSGRLSRLIRRYKPGDEVELLVVRARKEKSLTAVLGDRDFSELKPPVVAPVVPTWLTVPAVPEPPSVPRAIEPSTWLPLVNRVGDVVIPHIWPWKKRAAEAL